MVGFAFTMTPTNFELFACHQDLCIRNDGWREAELQPVGYNETTNT